MCKKSNSLSTLCVKGFHLIPLPLLPLTVPVKHQKGRKQNASLGGSITLTMKKDYIYYSTYTHKLACSNRSSPSRHCQYNSVFLCCHI